MLFFGSGAAGAGVMASSGEAAAVAAGSGVGVTGAWPGDVDGVTEDLPAAEAVAGGGPSGCGGAALGGGGVLGCVGYVGPACLPLDAFCPGCTGAVFFFFLDDG